jgi:hypothetical protein
MALFVLLLLVEDEKEEEEIERDEVASCCCFCCFAVKEEANVDFPEPTAPTRTSTMGDGDCKADVMAASGSGGASCPRVPTPP